MPLFNAFGWMLECQLIHDGKEFSDMHYGSKGWYVQELKKLGMTTYEGRKLQSYKTHFLANLLDTVKK